jgi:hypothetical protein
MPTVDLRLGPADIALIERALQGLPFMTGYDQGQARGCGRC